MRALCSVIVATGCVLLGPARIAAQCPPSVFSATNQQPGLDYGSLVAAEWDPDGAGTATPVTVVGGSFTFAGQTPANRIAFWDGTNWTALGDGVDGEVRALAVYNGELIAAGGFVHSGSTVVNKIARWDAEWGWQPLGGGVIGTVYALAVYNGELIVAGDFTWAGAGFANRVARWNGSSWTSLGSGMNAKVYALTVYGGNLIAGGIFTTAGGVIANEVAAWNGSTWSPLGALPGPPNAVRALAVQAGDLFLGGEVTNGPTTTGAVARWDGANWVPLGTGMNNSVNALASYNGELFAAGPFSSASGVPVTGIARWNGTTWSSVGSGIGYSPAGGSLEGLATANGELVLLGHFLSAGEVSTRNVARWNGTLWQPFGVGIDRAVRALTVFGGDLVAGGDFTAPGQPVGHANVTRWNGSSWQAVGAGVTGTVYALGTYGGDLVAGGNFGLIGGQVANGIARWTGSAWVSLGSGMSASGYVNALTVYNGDLIAAGFFSTAGGVPANSIARWDGTSWYPLGSGITGQAGQTFVWALTVWNGSLIAGGSFTTAGGLPATNIAQWNGSTWAALGPGLPGLPQSQCVFDLAAYGGDLIAAGYFGSFPAVHRWDGVAWLPLPVPVSESNVQALAVFNGELIAAGYFGGFMQPTNLLARWNGSYWQLQGLTNQFQPISALAVYQGALIAGGSFLIMDRIGSPFMARFGSPLPLLAFSQPAGNGTGVVLTNRWLVLGHEYYNLASPDPAPGGPGTGPYGGLFFNDVSLLLQQIAFPAGAGPFHFIAQAPDVAFGPYALPVGFALEAISVDVTGGVIGCLTPVQSLTVN